jgi:hypothetical protein
MFVTLETQRFSGFITVKIDKWGFIKIEYSCSLGDPIKKWIGKPHTEIKVYNTHICVYLSRDLHLEYLNNCWNLVV